MNKRRIAVAAVAVVAVAACAWGIWRAARQTTEQTPEQTLAGAWIQTQEHLDYENEHIHSASVTVTGKEKLVFQADGTGELTQPQTGITVAFTYEYRDGAVVLMPEGWAPLRYLLQDETLIDPEIDISKYEKQ